MRTSLKAGFTLIELLVVIVIIGLLASIVLVTLDRLRKQGRDARILSEMDLLRKAAETYQTISGNYVNFCGSDDVSALAKDIQEQKGTNYSCNDDAAGGGRSFCAQVTLNSGDTWCADSALTSQQGLTCTGTHPFKCQ